MSATNRKSPEKAPLTRADLIRAGQREMENQIFNAARFHTSNPQLRINVIDRYFALCVKEKLQPVNLSQLQSLRDKYLKALESASASWN